MSDARIEINEAVASEDGTLTLYLKAPDGAKTTLRLDARAQGIILQSLLGSTVDPLGPIARLFQPLAVSRFKAEDDVGVSFLLSPQIGIHLVLDRALAELLRQKLATFDDASSWESVTLN
jgi:hypothetical protein